MRCLANLDFEYELAGRSLAPGLFSKWRYILRLLPEARGAECLNPDQQGQPGSERLLSWGVSDRVRRLAPEQSWPAAEIVAEVNDKRFSHRLEHELGIALPGSRLIHCLDDLRTAVEECNQDWVLKHPLGVSARERAVGKRGRISESALGWARKQLVAWSLVFEPWVEPRQDFSMHFLIKPDGSVDDLGHCRLVGDPGGIYRGNLLDPGYELAPGAKAVGLEVARQVAAKGYWGPLGIDAFEGGSGLRPLVEINARHSFGRMTLALRQWAPPDWCLLWWHPRQPVKAKQPLTAKGLAGIYNLPLEADPDGLSGTVVILAPTHAEVESLRQGLTFASE